MEAAGTELWHVHFATPGARAFPECWDGRYGRFFAALANIGYGGRMSIEAFTSDFAADGARALSVLRQALAAPAV